MRSCRCGWKQSAGPPGTFSGPPAFCRKPQEGRSARREEGASAGIQAPGAGGPREPGAFDAVAAPSAFSLGPHSGGTAAHPRRPLLNPAGSWHLDASAWPSFNIPRRAIPSEAGRTFNHLERRQMGYGPAEGETEMEPTKVASQRGSAGLGACLHSLSSATRSTSRGFVIHGQGCRRACCSPSVHDE